jgi:hypothetical protein
VDNVGQRLHDAYKEVASLRARDEEWKQQNLALRQRVLELEREASAAWKGKALWPKAEPEERIRLEERLAVGDFLRAEAQLWSNRPFLSDVLRQLARLVEKRAA